MSQVARFDVKDAECSQYDPFAGLGSAPLGPVVRVELAILQCGPRIRLGRLNREHLHDLVQSGGNWPALIVRRVDNTIIDGLYRYLAAKEIGLRHLSCVYLDVGPEAAFLEALRRNLQHGLPLSLQERKVAASRLLTLRTEWSDRRVGEVCGLSAVTVASLRDETTCAGVQNGQLNTRIGRDGKAYPVDRGVTRARVQDALRENPSSSLRSIARATGTSAATVRSVRSSLPSPPVQEISPTADVAAIATDTSCDGVATALSSKSAADAALLSTDEGKDFAAWFERTKVSEDWRVFIDHIPISRIYEIADEARERSQKWHEFASTLEGRIRHG